jgi:hypothetical protein
VGTLDLGGANGSTLAFGGAGTDRPASLRFGTLTDTSINSSVPLRSVSATSFVAATNGGAGGNQTAGTLTAPAVGSLSTRGDFAQNVTVAGDVRTLSVGGNLAGSTIRAATLGSLSVRGDVTGSTVNVTRAFAAGERPLGRVNVGGAINNSAVRATGNIGTVSANAMTRSAIFAAIAETVPATSLPATADFTAEASITSVRVRTTTTASNVAAVNLGRLSLGTVQPAGGSTTPFGLSADRIASAAGQTAGGARFNLRRLETTADVQQQTAGLDLGNFRLTLV